MNSEKTRIRTLLDWSKATMSAYTLSDLVDQSLRFTNKKGPIANFRHLHTVLTALLEKLDLKDDVRPSDSVAKETSESFVETGELLAKISLMKAHLEEQPIKGKSEDFPAQDRKGESLMRISEEDLRQRDKHHSSGKDIQQEATSVSDTKATEDEKSADDQKEDSEDLQQRDKHHSSDKDIQQEATFHLSDTKATEGEQSDEHQKEDTEKYDLGVDVQEHPIDFRKAEETWKYTQLDARVAALDGVMMKLTEFIDRIDDRLKKVEAQPKGGPPGSELAKIWKEVEKLEQAFTAFREESKKRKGGASSAELEELEDRIEVLEEAKLVFDQDHVALEEVLKVQKQMTQEFEEIKALGNEIKNMKDSIALKAGMKEMEEALALKGDLSLLLTKVDQMEFETAIEELGEAIGTLGIKFTKKNDEWEEQSEDVWRAVEGKMSRDVFDSAVSKIESRIVAIMHALKTLKEVVEQLLYPDSSGVTRCILCRRPAAISGHECFDMKESPKRPHKPSESNSEDSMSIPEFKDEINKETIKKQKVGYSLTKPDTIIRIPYCSSTYRTEQDNNLEEYELNFAPFSKKIDDRPTSEITISLPKRHSRLPHRKLIFTHKMLEGSKKKDKCSSNFSHCSSDNELTPPKEEYVTCEIPEVMKDSLKNMDSFAPLKLMQDPLRREIMRSSNSSHQQNVNFNMAPLYPKSTRRPNYNASE
ncbi:hypothetical protein JTE90_006413 [Oedothorax gibbosus]|uniref:DUF4795 domain-containing protein n=1 Tax=Oedothorax gibbosus TaxID=931172 RepID=A0AAV6VVY0_9ARAC|nr:hypothetical protein JTE90_006413 [Oedothorax gibbosus]